MTPSLPPSLVHSPVEYTVRLQRSGKESLGFSIVGGANSTRGNAPVFIRSIASESVAAEDGRLNSRDEILKINGRVVSCLSQNEVVKFIRNTTGDITLTVILGDSRV